MKQDPVKPTRWLESVNCAIEGILWAARTQKHLRWHLVVAAAVLAAALYFRVPAIELMLLASAITLVVFAELMNTAVEIVVDMVCPGPDPRARRAKDVAAGAVLLASIGAAALGYFVFSRYLVPRVGQRLEPYQHIPGETAVIAVLAVTILVVLFKARLGRGTPLHGGMPSGHAAVAFSIATSVALAQVSLVIIILAMVLATMVSHSRLLMGIHSVGEVLAGAGLGIVLTLIIHLLL
ncbi:MAG: phosphatase PAP2 family protein [Deltaproteobacteria bacterium]|nr:MAG: phosphatase PAP2 family protein [Deltaproteobacteria bacterium]